MTVLPAIDLSARPTGGYRVIYADPPWRYELYSEAGEGKAPQAHYDCMSTAAIASLPVWQIAAADSALFLWATFPMLRDALNVMTAWGFAYKSGASWAKQSSTGRKWAFGPGYLFRSASELLLLGTRGAPRCQSKSVRNLIVAPVREHSRKPDDAYEMIEAMFPARPRVELFARTARPGWDAFGNEAGRWGE
jgi:N6-adenosine-specific RNA methylase IME4